LQPVRCNRGAVRLRHIVLAIVVLALVILMATGAGA
jgi:hypothetical protein